MSDFFDKYLNLKKIMEEKREYRQYANRIKALPEDYRYVYDKMQGYMWKFAGGDGYDMIKVQYDLIELFEQGAADGQPVLDITGEDVAAFCDELLRNAQTYTEGWRQALNRDIQKKLKKGRAQK